MGAMSGWEFFCALLLYPMSVIDTHLKLKFIQLKSMDDKSIQCHLGLGLGKVIVNLNHGLIGTSASSSPVLHLLPISSSPVLLLLPISGSSSSLPSSFIYFSRTWVFKTRVPCDENFSMSAIRTRVFVTRFFHKTRASDARDGMFLIFSRFLLTNYIVGQTPVILQIASSL